MGFLEWLKVVVGIEHFNAITSALKTLNEEYRIKISNQDMRIKELESLQGKSISVKDLEILLEREKDYHRQLIETLEAERNLKEEVIFLKEDIKRLKKIRIKQ